MYLDIYNKSTHINSFCFVRCTLKSSKRHSLRLIFYLPECRNANFVHLCRWQEEDFLKERSLSLPFHVYEALQSYYYVLNLMLTYIHDVVKHWCTMVRGKKRTGRLPNTGADAFLFSQWEDTSWADAADSENGLLLHNSEGFLRRGICASHPWNNTSE